MALTLFFSIAACGNGDNGDENGDNGVNGDNGDNGEVEYGDYKPGLHLGYTDGHNNTYAYVYVDAEGYIEDIFIDTVYSTTDDDEEDVYTTKMSLDYGCGYHMHRGKDVEYDEDGNCYVEDEMMWHEQVQALAADIVDNQGVPSYNIDEDGDFEDDAVAGVTITVTGYIEAIEKALD